MRFVTILAIVWAGQAAIGAADDCADLVMGRSQVDPLRIDVAVTIQVTTDCDVSKIALQRFVLTDYVPCATQPQRLGTCEEGQVVAVRGEPTYVGEVVVPSGLSYDEQIDILFEDSEGSGEACFGLALESRSLDPGFVKGALEALEGVHTSTLIGSPPFIHQPGGSYKLWIESWKAFSYFEFDYHPETVDSGNLPRWAASIVAELDIVCD